MLAPNAKLRALVVPQAPEEATGESEVPATESGCAHSRPARISWARLLKRVFEIDLEHCPNCGGELKIIAAILEAPGTRADPQAPGAGGPGTAPGAGARRSSVGGVIAARCIPGCGEGLRLTRAEPGDGLLRSGGGAAAAQCAFVLAQTLSRTTPERASPSE